jgi:hypothetical protein
MLKVTIPENVISIPNIVAQMQSINKVSTAYEVDFYTIKSKNNLIFRKICQQIKKPKLLQHLVLHAVPKSDKRNDTCWSKCIQN